MPERRQSDWRLRGEVLLDLAADASDVFGATRQSPIEFEGIRDRYLPEAVAHTKAQHHKSRYALRAAAMLHGGVDPGLLEEVQWWRDDDLWYWSLEAPAAYVRAVADRIADERGIHPHRRRRSLIVQRLLNVAAPKGNHR